MGFAQGHITVRRKPRDGEAGDSAIRVDLNNENDSLLYDAEGNLLSGSVVSVATLYKGEAAVSSGVVFSISERSGMSTAQATISGNTITVSGLSSSGYVMVAATYNNKTYYAKFSLKRIVGSVKYDLVVTPDAVAYNSTTGTKSASSINVKVFRTAQNGSDGTTREQVSAIPNGYSLKVDGTVVSGYGSNGYTFDVDVTKASHVVTLLQGTTIADEETIPINKSTNGAAGTNGMNTAIVYLYKRAATKPSIDWSGVLTYNFTNKALTSVPDGWSATIPANDGNPLYVTAATAASRTNEYNIAASEWADPVQLNSNGADGGAGLNSATVVLYKRAASEPSAPTSALTYTFATGSLSGTLSGWSLVMPETDGNPCWRIQATAISTAATDTIAASEWSTPTKVVVDGEDGSDAFRLDLNNENDSLLYDAEGNLLSGSVQSVATLYKGDTPVESGVTYSISERSGCSSSQATISGNVITVSGLSSSGYVMCKALFNGKSFFSKFSLKRLIGDVKYDLLVTPDAIAYNTTTGTKSSSTINVKVYRTAQNGSNGVDRTLVTSLPSGYSLKIDGTAVTYSGSGGYSFNVDVSRSSHVISLYNGSTLVDEETVPINKSTNGSDGRDGTDGTDGTDGVDGKNGNSIINRFMWSPTKPDTPTGTALLPSGWSENSDRESISPQYKSEDGSGESSFVVNGVFRQNPAIGDSQTIAERVVFTTTKANQILYIDLHADSESASYDYIAVSKLDNTAWTSNALAKIGGRNVSSVVKVLVPTAGTHFIIVGYKKDGSLSVGKDRGWYRFIPDENLNCWVSQGVVDGETGLVTSWSEPVKYVADSVDEESIYLLANSTATPSTPSSLPYVDDYVPPLVDDEFDSTKAYYSGSKFMYNGKAYNTIATYHITLQYDSTTVYYADDEFIYNGKAYLCIADCPYSGIIPTNTNYFDEILPTNSSNYFEEIPTWTDNPSNVSSAYRYQFVCERKKENGQWGAFTTPHLYNTAGISGLDYRIEYWQSGQEYHNDINDLDADPRIIHICTNMPIALYTDTNFRAYQCVRTHTSSSSIQLGAEGYWTRINNLGPLITVLVLAGKIVADHIDVGSLAADTAFINALSVKHLDAADGVFTGSFSANATRTEEGADYTHSLIIDPEVIKIEARRGDGGEFEAVRIWPLADPDRYDRNALMELEANSDNSVALDIQSGRVQGLNQGIQKFTSGGYIDSRYQTILVLTTGSLTLRLPPVASRVGVRYKVMNMYGASITLATYDGAAKMRVKGDSATASLYSSKIFTASVNSFEAVSDGSYWYVISNNS